MLFASTNFPENLDAALRRPGRFDVDLKFDYATHEQAMDIYKHFYSSISLQPEDSDMSNAPSASSIDEKPGGNDEAEHFADVIKDANIKVSIATIQGFLLLYKREPEIVQEKVAEWAEEIRVEQSPGTKEKDEASESEAEVETLRAEGEGPKGAEVIKAELQETRAKRLVKEKEGAK